MPLWIAMHESFMLAAVIGGYRLRTSATRIRVTAWVPCTCVTWPSHGAQLHVDARNNGRANWYMIGANLLAGCSFTTAYYCCCCFFVHSSSIFFDSSL